MRTLFVGLAFIVSTTFLSAAVISGVSPKSIGVRFVLLGLGVFGFEWCGTPFGSVGKKLGSALFCSVILTSSNPTANLRNPIHDAMSLSAGLALGCLGALIGWGMKSFCCCCLFCFVFFGSFCFCFWFCFRFFFFFFQFLMKGFGSSASCGDRDGSYFEGWVPFSLR